MSHLRIPQNLLPLPKVHLCTLRLSLNFASSSPKTKKNTKKNKKIFLPNKSQTNKTSRSKPFKHNVLKAKTQTPLQNSALTSKRKNDKHRTHTKKKIHLNFFL